jgi:hypothetical protein
MERIKSFERFILLLEERGSSIAVRTIVKDIINLFKSGVTGTFYLPQDRNTKFDEYKHYPDIDEDEYDEDEDEEIEVKYDFPDFPMYFFVKVKLVQNRRIKRFRIDASAGVFDIDFKITYNPNTDMTPYWDEMSAELNVDVAHELEHLLQHYYGEFVDDKGTWSSSLEYYMLPIEVPAQVAGFKRLYDLERKGGRDIKLEDLIKKWFNNNRYISKLKGEDEEKIIQNILDAFKNKYGYK